MTSLLLLLGGDFDKCNLFVQHRPLNHHFACMNNLWMCQQKRKRKTGQKGIPPTTQIVIDTYDVKVKEKIMHYEALVEEVVGTSVNSPDNTDENEGKRPSSIVVSEAEDALQPSTSSNRNSILSTSSVDSTRSDSINDKNIQLGSSVFYVVWD